MILGLSLETTEAPQCKAHSFLSWLLQFVLPDLWSATALPFPAFSVLVVRSWHSTARAVTANLKTKTSIWGYPEMENPPIKMDDLGGTPF